MARSLQVISRLRDWPVRCGFCGRWPFLPGYQAWLILDKPFGLARLGHRLLAKSLPVGLLVMRRLQVILRSTFSKIVSKKTLSRTLYDLFLHRLKKLRW